MVFNFDSLFTTFVTRLDSTQAPVFDAM